VDVLVLGGTGMLGHKMFQTLGRRFAETWCAIRRPLTDPALARIDILRSEKVLHADAADFPSLERILLDRRPDVIVNCVGVVKQRAEATAPVPSILINSLLPHRLLEACGRWHGRLIHISTDCVFSGHRGGYLETDVPDAEDLYGRTKALGEVQRANALTLRTSIIGRELFHFRSLLEWFLSQSGGRVRGFRRAQFSGVTTNLLSEVVADIIANRPDLGGLYQVTGPMISKFDLLTVLRDAYRLDVEIVSDDDFVCDRSMNGEKFRQATGFRCPAWPELAAQLAADPTPYDAWRKSHE
jgi:dTDP-4-dehydrorhamnose reductase